MSGPHPISWKPHKSKHWPPPTKKEFCRRGFWTWAAMSTLPWVSNLPASLIRFWGHQASAIVWANFFSAANILLAKTQLHVYRVFQGKMGKQFCFVSKRMKHQCGEQLVNPCHIKKLEAHLQDNWSALLWSWVLKVLRRKLFCTLLTLEKALLESNLN